MSSDRYMQRGVSASKEDVHKAIANLDKGLFPQAFCKISQISWAVMQTIATSCTRMGQVRSLLWPTYTGKKPVTSPYGAASRKTRW